MAATHTQDHKRKWHSPVQILQGVLPVEGKRLPSEIIAGVTLATLAIPEVMGYTKIAGMPVITGLYTILVPIAVFALFGSSRHLIVGADSATAAILAAGLAGMAAPSSAQYVALAGMLAIMAGGFLLLARILRLGFIADFLSRTVLIGFLAGVGIQVACGQFSGLFGIPKTGSGPVQQVVNTFKDLGSTNWETLVVSACVALLIVGGGFVTKRIPWALIAVIGAIVASYALDLSADGVGTLGTIPGGLPHFGWPSVSASEVAKLAGTAASIFVVILAQSAATSRAYAAKYSDRFDENVDLVGLSFANVAAGFSGTFVVNGSPTKTEMIDSAGGRSQISSFVTAAIVLIVLLFLTGPLGYMPNAVLATVVFIIGVRLVDVRGMALIFRRRPWEFGVAFITAAIVVFVGVEQGIIAAIVLSIIIHLRHSYKPNDRLMGRTAAGRWKGAALSAGVEAAPGLLVYRFGASLYYANANRFQAQVTTAVASAKPAPRWFCLGAGVIEDIDFSGSATLREVIGQLKERGVTLVLCEVGDLARAELDRDGLTALIGEEYIFDGIDDVLDAFEKLPPAPEAAANAATAPAPPDGRPA
jgi:sulfate permease, SulP family